VAVFLWVRQEQMMRRCHIAGVATILCALAAVADAPASDSGRVMARVMEERAALYAGADSPQENVAAWLPPATELEVCGAYDAAAPWVTVRPPDSLTLFIYCDLVKDGRVTADQSQVRSSPSSAARAVGSLNKGDLVEVRGVYGDWHRIAPPAAMRFWMKRDQVEIFVKMSDAELSADLLRRLHAAFSVGDNDVSGQAGTNVLSAALAATTSVASVVAELPRLPAELAGYVLDETKEQGKPLILSGILDWGGVGEVKAPFTLVELQADGGAHILCHLFAQDQDLSNLLGASITAQGIGWYVRGSGPPVLLLEKYDPR